MLEMPLFPLGSVLFPGMSINLHIFEERYKQMINLCLETRQPFGVALIQEGREAYGSATPFMIGCTAQITRMQPLDDGQMEITVTGKQRFEIQSLLHDRPYLVGMVNLQPVKNTNPALVSAAVRHLRPMVSQYLDLLGRASETQLKVSNMPQNPVEFCYLAAAILQQIPQTTKQNILELDDAVNLLEEVTALYHVELSLLEKMLQRAQNNPSNSVFSLN